MVLNMKMLNIGLLFLLFTFISCDNGTEEAEKNYVIAYCDMSKSIDEATRDLVISNVQGVIDLVPYYTDFYMYSVNQSTGSASLVEYEKEQQLDDFNHTPSDLREQEAKIEERSATAKDEVENSLIKAYEKDDGGDNSCILNKFSRVKDVFKGFGDGNYYMVIFSDMIEDCDKSILNKEISMERSRDVESIQKLIKEEWNTAPNLAQLGVKLFVVHTTVQDESSAKGISYEEKRMLWNDIFSQLGYSANQVQSIHWSDKLPNGL